MIDDMSEIDATIQPEKQSDQDRWHEQALRHRLLTGAQADDVRDEIKTLFAGELAADLSINPDISRNPFKSIFQQLNTAYSEPPEILIADGDEADLAPIVTPRLAAQQQQAALFALAIGESLIRLDFKHWLGATEVSYRVVPADVVVIEPLPGQPDTPGMVKELRARGNAWSWETWDIRDPQNPTFSITELDDGEWVDATAKHAPELEGQYPYMDTSGAPILPYILKHKTVGSKIWNWTESAEVAHGTLRLAALWSQWCDSYTSSSHPQRWCLDVETQAGITRQYNGQSIEVIPTDRKSIIKFTSKGPSGGSLGSFPSAMAPLEGADALRIYATGLSTYAGLNPSDLQVTQAQSGYAIVVSRDGMRRAQKRVEPSFRFSDQDLLATAARLSNFYLGTKLPEDPRAYSIRYRALGQSIQERKALAEELKLELDLGLISKVEALRRLHPEIETEEEAMARLLKLRSIERELEELESLAQGQAETNTPESEGT